MSLFQCSQLGSRYLTLKYKVSSSICLKNVFKGFAVDCCEPTSTLLKKARERETNLHRGIMCPIEQQKGGTGEFVTE